MSGSRTTKMLRLYEQTDVNPNMFFAGMFEVTADSFFNTEEVEIDVVRADQSIAITVQDVSAGYRMNADSIFKNQKIVPPPFKEAFTVNAFELLRRQPGQDPFADPNIRLNLITKVFKGTNRIARKIRRANELQASQVLLEGKATFRNEEGQTLYTLSYNPSASHYPTAAVAWDQAGADIVGDLEGLANVIRTDGLVTPNRIVFGSAAFAAAMKNEAFLKRFDIRNANFGVIQPPVMRGQGGIYHGMITLGSYQYEVWTYDGTYEDPETGVITPYMTPSKVLVMSTQTRLDAAFGAVPNIGELLGASTRAQYLPELPPRLSSIDGAFDIFLNAWMDERMENLFAGAASRPLFIPTNLDGFGAIATGV